MKRLRPSLVRRLTLGFVVANAAAVLLFLVGAVYIFALIEEGEPPGPEVAIAVLQGDLTRDGAGSVRLRESGRFHRFAGDHPAAWFLVRGEGGGLTFGPVPAGLGDRIGARPELYQARYRNLGAKGPVGDAVTTEVEVGGTPVLVTAGGIRTRSLGFGDHLTYIWREGFFLFPLFTAFFNLFAPIIAIPIVLRALRPTARAAERIEPADLSARLPEAGVVKEMLPIVRAFNAALDRLSDAFERRRRFIADVAHELRTPLAVLSMHVEALPDGAREPDLHRTVYRLAQMVGQMLDSERLVLAERRHEEVDLVELAREAVAEAAPLAVANGYEMGFAAAAAPVIVCGDPHSIARAVSNLIGNAIAHGGASGMIEVRVHDSGAIEVADQGPGVPVEARERIFEPFRRERWDKDGCGLGLYLVREIMVAHGGKARLASAGPGAVFRLEFPPDAAAG